MDAEKLRHVHESPKSMTVVLSILAALSLLGGYVGLPAWLGPNWFEHFLEPVFAWLPPPGAAAEPAAHHLSQELAVTGISIVAALLGLGLAFLVYAKRRMTPEREAALGGLHRLIFNKYYVDELYLAAVVRPLHKLSDAFLWRIFDSRVIDGLVNGYGTLAAALGEVARRLQNGFARSYLGWVVVGSICIGLYILLLRG